MYYSSCEEEGKDKKTGSSVSNSDIELNLEELRKYVKGGGV